MSSILKALKKLEDEKTARQPDTLKIDADILKIENVRRHSTTGMILAALLLFAGGSVATYFYMKKDSSPVVDVSKKTVEISSGAKSTTPVQPPVTTVKELKTERLPDDIPIAPAKPSADIKIIPPPKPQKPKPLIRPTPISTPQIQPRSDNRKSNPAVTTTQPDAVVKTIPVLRVNGIAFQDGATDSVAIVNGVPVSSGSVVEGTKVEAIQKDRVRFSYKGETFEISLGKSNR